MTDMGLAATVDMVKQRNTAIEMAEKRKRQEMTLIAPVVDRMPQLYPMVHSQDQYFAIKNCHICNPPVKLFCCPICDYETEEKWRMQVHNFGSEQNYFCKKRQKAKQKAWANRVGLDG